MNEDLSALIERRRPCDNEVEVYLGEGIWWRITRAQAMRHSYLRQRALKAKEQSQ